MSTLNSRRMLDSRISMCFGRHTASALAAPRPISVTTQKVARQPAVAVVLGIGRRIGGPVGARVVGQHAVPGALERPRAHHDVAPCRRQSMQEDDRRIFAGVQRYWSERWMTTCLNAPIGATYRR